MKSVYKILIGDALIFGIVTLATSSLHYDADGADNYGFPFSFYTKVSGYNVVTNEGDTSIQFRLFALLGDIVLAFLGSWLIFKLINKLYKKGNV